STSYVAPTASSTLPLTSVVYNEHGATPGYQNLSAAQLLSLGIDPRLFRIGQEAVVLAWRGFDGKDTGVSSSAASIQALSLPTVTVMETRDNPVSIQSIQSTMWLTLMPGAPVSSIVSAILAAPPEQRIAVTIPPSNLSAFDPDNFA